MFPLQDEAMTTLPQDGGLQRGNGRNAVAFAGNSVANRAGLSAKLSTFDDQDHMDSFADLMRRLAAAHERELQSGLEELRKENARLRASLHRGGPAETLQPLEGSLGSPGPPARRSLNAVTPTKPTPSKPEVDLCSLVPTTPCKEPPPLPVASGPLLNVPLSKEDDEGPSEIEEAVPGMVLTVHIERASGLASIGRDNCTFMPYCVVEVPGRLQEEVFRTECSQETQNPVWDHSEVVADFKAEDCLVFKICNNGELLGHAKLDSSQLKRDFEGDLQLVHSEDWDSDEDMLLSVRAAWTEQKPNSKTSWILRPMWHEDKPDKSWKSRVSLTHTMATSSKQTSGMQEPVDVPIPAIERSGTCMDYFIGLPGSRPRLIWDLIGAVWIVYDSLSIPLQVFNPPETLFGLVMDIIILIYWTLNMPATLTVGYIKHGNLEMHPCKILLNYLKTWFLVDIVVVGPDWYFTIQNLGTHASGAGQSVKLLRMLRLVRTVRLVRLLKLRWIMIMINDLLASEYASILANIAKMIALLIIINHFIACIFFLIADLQIGSGPTWVTEHEFDQVSWGYQYLTSFHWSITQFTPASMHVQPQNALERTFSILVVVFALVGFSYLVGSITNSMSQLRSMSEDASKQFWILRRYLKHHQVPPTLSTRIQRYIEHAWQRQKASVSEPKLFNLLSEQLSCELQCARSLPHLLVHPLFECLEKNSYISMQRLACSAINWRNLARDDTLFLPREVATHLYFVVEGKLVYTKTSGADEVTEWVDRAEDWIAEPVLWTPTWIHLGTLKAVVEADLVLIDGERFGSIIGRSPVTYQLVGNYARVFMAWMNNQPFENLSDISQGEDVSDKLRGFIKEAQVDE